MSNLKHCNKCDTTKRKSEFHKRSDRPDGLHYYCKECNKQKTSEWQKANPEKANENGARWRRTNPEKAKEVRQKHYLKKKALAKK